MYLLKFTNCLAIAAMLCLASKSAWTQESCSIDSIKTHRLVISTGIGANGVSDSVVLAGGYGGNSAYPTPNNHVDTFWSVSKLSSIYNPRIAGSYPTYSGSYLSVGGNPFVITDTSTPVYSYWAAFGSGGTCIALPTGSDWVSNWISVYSDAGGQNGNIMNNIGDGYAFDRCFNVCSDDTLTFDMKLMADDLIDSVLVDTNHLYITAQPTAVAQYVCGAVISLNKKLFMKSGVHFITVWWRDDAGGHLGLNVYGSITASGAATNKSIFRSKFDSKCIANHSSTSVNNVPNNTSDIIISPNPNDGNFNLNINSASSLLEVYDYSGRKIFEQKLKEGNNTINLNLASGLYLLKIRDSEHVSVRKIIVR